MSVSNEFLSSSASSSAELILLFGPFLLLLISTIMFFIFESFGFGGSWRWSRIGPGYVGKASGLHSQSIAVLSDGLRCNRRNAYGPDLFRGQGQRTGPSWCQKTLLAKEMRWWLDCCLPSPHLASKLME